MICKDCRSEKCERCKGKGLVDDILEVIVDGVVESAMPVQESCGFCLGTGWIKRSDHEACIEKNEGRVPSDCDCHHRE